MNIRNRILILKQDLSSLRIASTLRELFNYILLLIFKLYKINITRGFGV